MAAATLSSLLPAPLHYEEDSIEQQQQQPVVNSKKTAAGGAGKQEQELASKANASLSLVSTKSAVPAYGQRKGWLPKGQQDFGDGGAFPECHRAQYPLDLGKKRTSSNTLALQADKDGKVR